MSSMPSPDDEIVVIHRDRPSGSRMVRQNPLPELGTHVHGPRILSSNESGAVALRGVYAYSWGAEIEVTAVRRKWEVQAGHGGPIAGYQLGLALSKAELDLRSLAPEEDGSFPWLIGGFGQGQIGYEYSMTSVLALKPYPAMGSVWLGWSWPDLEIDQGSTELMLPAPGTYEPTIM
jgi:hypothetical protein